MTRALLNTQNEAYGFFGTITALDHKGWTAQEAWTIASTMISDATGCGPEGIRDFLDARDGRHFADEVANQAMNGTTLTDAIAAAVNTYQSWKIGKATQRRHGIPAYLPYLTGWVAHYEILDEAKA